jgi:hypothetical protein
VEIDLEFWKNQLEVPVDIVLERADEQGCAKWLAELSPACRTVLAEHLGLPFDLPRRALLKAVRRWRDHLAIFFLIDQALWGRRQSALNDVAHATLPASAQTNDRRALGWRLFLQSPINILHVVHLHRLHTHGTTSMVLRDGPARCGPMATLDTGKLRGLLGGAPIHVLTTGEQHIVFVRCVTRSDFVVQGTENVFGRRSEWVVLAFSKDLTRVRIASDVPGAGQIAGIVASALLDADVAYVTETAHTPHGVAQRFIDDLLEDRTGAILIGAAVRPHKGSTLVSRVLNDENTTAADWVRAHQQAFGPMFWRAERVLSLRLFVLGRRLELTLEHSSETCVVRYMDARLAPAERRAFEDWVHSTFGIVVLPQENQHVA